MTTSQTDSQANREVDEERLLLRLIAANDRDAMTDLYHRYHPRLFKFIFRLTRSYTMAEELVNDIMLAVWRSADKFRGDSKPSTWIFGIAYRQSLKRLSRKRLKTAADVDLEDVPDDRPQMLEQRDWIRRSLESLPAAQRVAVELVFYLGLSYDEVAAVTDCPVNTVKTRMFHARRRLRQQLESSAAGTASPGDIE